ncbi:hypothetical protein P9761_04345 [Brevibacillus centrosporus]|uniref:hypothetical protein n=1 Tax=Brevibacillus centrosporus TaxID=54910 RepID=UPI002E2434CB|nr:hypothetical protein [Brevibacillus centrosporus]
MDDLLAIEQSISMSMMEQYSHLLRTGEQIQAYIQANKKFVLEEKLISKAIVTRMFYANRDSREYSDKIKRIKKPPLGDFFTESVALYTLAYLKNINGFDIVMEQQFMGKRPDILIKKHGTVEYVFEMKIDMGYGREKWQKVYNEKVVAYGLPPERVCLIVLSSSNWSGFEKDKPDNWISLSKRHPNDSNNFSLYKTGGELAIADFDDFIEPLLLSIEETIR